MSYIQRFLSNSMLSYFLKMEIVLLLLLSQYARSSRTTGHELISMETTPFSAEEGIFFNDRLKLFSLTPDSKTRGSIKFSGHVEAKQPGYEPYQPGQQRIDDSKTSTIKVTSVDNSTLTASYKKLGVVDGVVKPSFIEKNGYLILKTSGEMDANRNVYKGIQLSPSEAEGSGLEETRNISISNITEEDNGKSTNNNITTTEIAHHIPERIALRQEAVEGCPKPRVCAVNCFVYINENGCQDCQCLWQSLICDTDDDCPESAQYCDLGKCNCRIGLRQDMTLSGFCEEDPNFKKHPSETEQFGRWKRGGNHTKSTKEISLFSFLLKQQVIRNMNHQLKNEESTRAENVRPISHSKANVKPPAPPPQAGQVSRITSTFPDLPPLQPLPRLINIALNENTFIKTAKREKEDKKVEKSKLTRLTASSTLPHISTGNIEGMSLMPPLSMSAQTVMEELRQSQRKKAA